MATSIIYLMFTNAEIGTIDTWEIDKELRYQLNTRRPNVPATNSG